jgi:chloride channel 2
VALCSPSRSRVPSSWCRCVVLFWNVRTSSRWLLMLCPQNYWRAFVASISALLAREAVYMLHQDWVAAYHAMFPTSFVAESFSFAEIVAFAVLAVLTGLLGALYASLATAFRLRWKAWAADQNAVLASWTILFPLAALLCLPFGMTRLSFADILVDLTSTEPTLPDRWHAELSLSVFMVLPLAGLTRLVVTALSFTLPVPSGDFVPTFIAGATFGRFFGEVLRLVFPAAGIVPGGYALAGGAGFVASTTNTTSVAVIALEFTGQFVYTIPLILSTLIASGVGCALRVSVYDSVIAQKGFSRMRTLDLGELKACDVMLRRFPVLTLAMDRAQLVGVLKITSESALPLVDDLDSMVFIGCVPRPTVERFIRLGKLEDESGSSIPLRSVLHLPQQPEVARTAVATLPPVKEDGGTLLTTALQPPQSTSSVDQTPPVPDDNNPLEDLVRLRTGAEPLSAASSLAKPSKELVDSTALQVDPDTPLQNVHLLFEMIKCSSIWVTMRGRLVGLLHRQNLHVRVAELKRKGDIVCPNT